jgi:hypothetical protein
MLSLGRLAARSGRSRDTAAPTVFLDPNMMPHSSMPSPPPCSGIDSPIGAVVGILLLGVG